MIYEYKCQGCGHEFSESLKIEDRDRPLSAPCPHCHQENVVTRVFNGMSIAYSGFKSNVTRAGSGWNDVLKKIKAGAGKNNTIQTN